MPGSAKPQTALVGNLITWKTFNDAQNMISVRNYDIRLTGCRLEGKMKGAIAEPVNCPP